MTTDAQRPWHHWGYTQMAGLLVIFVFVFSELDFILVNSGVDSAYKRISFVRMLDG